MTYDEGLAELVRSQLHETPGYSERRMFGGLCFMINGNMACGVVKNQLMVRIGKENYEDALQQEYVTKMDFTGKEMRGMIYITEEGSQQEDTINYWTQKGKNYAKSLDPKT